MLSLLIVSLRDKAKRRTLLLYLEAAAIGLVLAAMHVQAAWGLFN